MKHPWTMVIMFFMACLTIEGMVDRVCKVIVYRKEIKEYER